MIAPCSLWTHLQSESDGKGRDVVGRNGRRIFQCGTLIVPVCVPVTETSVEITRCFLLVFVHLEEVLRGSADGSDGVPTAIVVDSSNDQGVNQSCSPLAMSFPHSCVRRVCKFLSFLGKDFDIEPGGRVVGSIFEHSFCIADNLEALQNMPIRTPRAVFQGNGRTCDSPLFSCVYLLAFVELGFTGNKCSGRVVPASVVAGNTDLSSTFPAEKAHGMRAWLPKFIQHVYSKQCRRSAILKAKVVALPSAAAFRPVSGNRSLADCLDFFVESDIPSKLHLRVIVQIHPTQPPVATADVQLQNEMILASAVTQMERRWKWSSVQNIMMSPTMCRLTTSHHDVTHVWLGLKRVCKQHLCGVSHLGRLLEFVTKASAAAGVGVGDTEYLQSLVGLLWKVQPQCMFFVSLRWP